MILRLRVFVLLACIGIGCAYAIQATAQTAQGQSRQDHVAWVAQALKRMQTIKPGVTRETLFTVFTTEGGLTWHGQQTFRQTFVSRDCPYFKVDVELQAVGRPSLDGHLVEDGQDIILKISRPYLEFTIAD